MITQPIIDPNETYDVLLRHSDGTEFHEPATGAWLRENGHPEWKVKEHSPRIIVVDPWFRLGDALTFSSKDGTGEIEYTPVLQWLKPWPA